MKKYLIISLLLALGACNKADPPAPQKSEQKTEKRAPSEAALKEITTKAEKAASNLLNAVDECKKLGFNKLEDCSGPTLPEKTRKTVLDAQKETILYIESCQNQFPEDFCSQLIAIATKKLANK